MRKKKTKKENRFPDFDLVDIPSHMLDSLWIKKDGTELKIVFATGQIADFVPSLQTLEDNLKQCD